jgi:Zn-dependent M28 family amino/carboxypeptidase
VSAHHDGVGTEPRGTVYPAANDNASGLAMTLEMARLLKASPSQPGKAVLLVAWAVNANRT